ncbi:TRAF-like protein [Corchorus capsularis]|uniref:TRAF-like protein n=1 Tax=Corchorus capsularis TaxID=210143 RepID=A0A1R3HGY5_COCAP|nr:TRAF-like protein [Corchorus capsularis]
MERQDFFSPPAVPVTQDSVERWFSATSVNWGYPQFMALKTLQDASKGFLVYDCLIVEAEITVVSKVKRFS